jgi:predicted kinase
VFGDGGEVRIVDCAEFDSELRTIDVGADLAFLVMDLAALGRPDLGPALVAAYRDAGGDPGTDEMIAYHAATRAWVRAKLALIRSRQPEAPLAGAHEAGRLFALGERFAWSARLPLVLILCGPPASGKSQLARALAHSSGLVVRSSDETRKRLAGLEPTRRAPAAAYTSEASERTYAELGASAAAALERTGGVIVDATFGTTRDRRAFEHAVGDVAPIFVECRAAATVTAAWAAAREGEADSVSDAGPEVAARLRASFAPLEDYVPASRHIALRTDQPLEHALADLVAGLDRLRLARAAEEWH